MWFYEVFVALVFTTIGTVVGSVLTMAFGLPLGIATTWFGKEKKSAAPVVKEVRRF